MSSRSVWPFSPSTVLLVATRPAEQGMILHLREVAGQNAALDLVSGSHDWKMEEVDALGTPLRDLTNVSFKPLESKFIRMWK